MKFYGTAVDHTRNSIRAWIDKKKLAPGEHLFPSRNRNAAHISTRQYGRIVNRWVTLIGLDPKEFETHTLLRTEVNLIFRRTMNLRAAQLRLGHRMLESTVRYLGIEVGDALEIVEYIET